MTRRQQSPVKSIISLFHFEFQVYRGFALQKLGKPIGKVGYPFVQPFRLLQVQIISRGRGVTVCVQWPSNLGDSLLLFRKSAKLDFGHPAKQYKLESDQCLKRGISSLLVSHSKVNVFVISLLIYVSAPTRFSLVHLLVHVQR